jgi:branched-chain amino acid transport system substrate-binding protein
MKMLRLWAVMILIAVLFLGCTKQEPAPTQNALKIGAILPLTGPASAVGEQIQKAMTLANEQTKYNIIFEDSANMPAKGVSAFNKLSKLDKVDAVVVAMTGVSKAVAPVAKSEKLPTFAISTSVPVVGSSKDFLVRYFIDGVSEAESMAKYLVDSGKRRIVVIKVNDEYGSVMFESFNKALTAKSLSPVYVESFDRDITDFRSAAAKVKTFQPDCVYFIGYAKPLATVMKQTFEAGVRPQYASTFGFEIPGTKELAGESANGLVYTSILFGETLPSSPESKDFIHKFSQHFNQQPSNDAAFGYDLIKSFSSLVGGGALKDPSTLVGKTIGSQFGNITFNERLEARVPIVIKKLNAGQVSVVPSL